MTVRQPYMPISVNNPDLDTRRRQHTARPTAESISLSTRALTLVMKNTAFSVLGQIAPMLAAIVSVPNLIAAFGAERFGMLTMIWTLVGYSALFDFGVGRALTKAVAEGLARGDHDRLRSVIFTGLTLMFTFACLGGVLLWIGAHPIATELSGANLPMKEECRLAIRILALSLPIVIVTGGLIGVIEGYQRFDLTNALRIPLAIFNYVGPLLISRFTHDLAATVSVLFAGRLVALVAYVVISRNLTRDLSVRYGYSPAITRSLMSVGGWLTVTGIISPLMVSLDRFIVAASISAAAVTYYATPQEIATRLAIVPAAATGVLFAAFAGSVVVSRARTAYLFDRSLNYTVALMFPLCLLAVAGSNWVLTAWLGAPFAKVSWRVLDWLTIGVFINSIARVPFSFLQSVGRADVTAKVHTVEIVLFLSVLRWSCVRYGVEGAAAIWAGRMALDAILLLSATIVICPFVAEAVRTALLRTTVLVLVLLGCAFSSPALRCAVALVAFLVSLPGIWFTLLRSDERAWIRSRVGFEC